MNLNDKDLQLGAGIGPSSGISCSRGYINRHEYTAKVGQTSRLERTRRAHRGRRRPCRTDSQPSTDPKHCLQILCDHRSRRRRCQRDNTGARASRCERWCPNNKGMSSPLKVGVRKLALPRWPLAIFSFVVHISFARLPRRVGTFSSARRDRNFG